MSAHILVSKSQSLLKEYIVPHKMTDFQGWGRQYTWWAYNILCQKASKLMRSCKKDTGLLISKMTQFEHKKMTMGTHEIHKNPWISNVIKGNNDSLLKTNSLLWKLINEKKKHLSLLSFKNKQMGLHQTKKIVHSQRNHQQNEKTTH